MAPPPVNCFVFSSSLSTWGMQYDHPLYLLIDVVFVMALKIARDSLVWIIHRNIISTIYFLQL